MAIIINGTSGISGVDGSAGTPALQGSDTNTGISFGTDEVNINTGGSTRATVDSSGNVGIGTASPGAALDVVGELYAGNGTITNYFTYSIGNSTGVVGTKTNHALEIRTNNIERMRITSTGDLRFNSGYGSVATAYGVRAWWRGVITNPPTTNASQNISSMTFGGSNDNILAFTNAMPDANYCTVGTCASGVFVNVDSQSTASAQIRARDFNGSYSGGPASIIVVR